MFNSVWLQRANLSPGIYGFVIGVVRSIARTSRYFFFLFHNSLIKKIHLVGSGCCTPACPTPRKTVGVLVCGALLVLLSFNVSAQQSGGRQKIYDIQLPSQSVARSLADLSKQTDQMLLFSHDVAERLNANPVQGKYTLQQALDALLEGTGFSGSLTQRGVLMISLKKSGTAENNQTQGKTRMVTRKKILASVIAFLGVNGAPLAVAQDHEMGQKRLLEEVIVTATKRTTALNDTPLSIAAIGSEEIARKNLGEMGDYLRTTPGVNFVEGSPTAGTGIVVRGLTTNAQADGGARAPVGIYYGDVPLTGAVIAGGAADLRMVDLERVEVLRGPQGTLFGSGTFAGAVRNIPHAPVLNEFEGSVKATYSETTGTGSDNNKLEGVVNIPMIEDRLALRAVAYRHENSGYIENIAGTVLAEGGEIFPGRSAQDYVDLYGGASLYQNHSDVGRLTNTGGRASLLWQATEDFKVTLMHVYEEVEQDGQNYVELGNAALSGTPYAQTTLSFSGSDTPALAGIKENSQEADTNLTNLVMEYDFGWASLLSSSAWLKMNRFFGYDASGIVSQPWAQIFTRESDRFVQEVRLASQLEGRFQYLLGVYYDESDHQNDGPIYGMTEEVAIARGWGSEDRFSRAPFGPQTLDQTALFGELSYDLTEQLELTVGGRYFDYTQSNHGLQRQRENQGGGIIETRPYQEFGETGTAYKVNLSYRPNDDMLFYALWSQGFRLGGLNALSPDDQVPQTFTIDIDNNGIIDGTNVAVGSVDAYDSDRTDNYELGAKLSLLDQRLQVNAAVYRVDWTDLPVRVDVGTRFLGDTLNDPPSGLYRFFINAGKARSQGLELEVTYQLTSNLRVNLGGAYNDAELLTDLPQVNAVSGDRLTNAPEISYNLGLLYEDDFDGLPWFVSADYAHVGEFYSEVGERGQASGDYGKLDMSAGITLNQFEVELFGQNLTNSDALTHMENSAYADLRGTRLRPRTMGLNVRYKF